MSYQLPPDVEARINAHVATGEYSSPDDVLRDALKALDDNRRHQQELTSLKAKLRIAEDQSQRGESGPFHVEATKHAVRERLAQQGISD